MTESQEYSLARTGQTNIEFTGVQIAQGKSPAFLKHERVPASRAHWFEGAIYRTKGGKFILQLAYRWSGKLSREQAQDFVTVHSDVRECLAALSKFDPTECVNGFPESDHWAPKQTELMNSIQADFDLLVENLETQAIRSTQPAERVE